MKTLTNLFLAVATMAIIVSCQKEIPTSNSNLTSEQEHKLGCNGFNPATTEYINGKYLIDGDFLIDDSHFSNNNIEVELIPGRLDDKETIELRQYATYGNSDLKVALSSVSYIKYFVDPTLNNIFYPNRYWKPAIKNAVDAYSGIPNCCIYFVETFDKSNADVIFFLNGGVNQPIGWDQTCNTQQGLACFPKNGKIGKYIGLCEININNKVQLVMHEIGHALGQRHVCNGEPAQGIDNNYCNTSVNRFQIIGTQLCDNSSIMKTPVAANGFSPDDLKSWRYLYPDNYNAPQIIQISKWYNSVSGWNVKIKTSSTPSPQLPYRVSIGRYHGTNGGSALSASHYYDPANNKSEYSMLNVPSGTWRFKIFYYNHGSYYVGSNMATITI